MVRDQTLTEHVPMMRRYARALRGSQEKGDADVRTCLAGLLQGTAAIDDSAPAKVALFKAFHALSRSEDSPVAGLHSIDRKLHSIDELSRRVLLLTAMEGFSREDVADILGIDQGEVAAHLHGAVEEITRQPRTRVLIIEDEPIISMDLVEIMRGMGHEVVDVGSTHRRAVEAARYYRPGLLLADINLADGSSGIDAVQEILADVKIPVVFVTAFPEKLLTGHAPEPTFLVTKPFVSDAVRAAVGQALFSS